MKYFCICAFCALIFAGSGDTQAMEISLEWDTPTNTVDDAPITDLCHYVVCYGTESGNYTQDLTFSCAETNRVISGLEYNKTYYFSVKACTSNALESDLSEELVWSAPQMPDEDGDLLSDLWEMEIFHALDTAGDCTDCDKDGLSDLDEFIAGTNPLSRDEYPQVSINDTANDATLSFLAQPTHGDGYQNRKRYYTLKRCTDLSTGIWEPIPGHERILAMGQTVTYEISMDQQVSYYCTSIELE